MPQQLSHHRFIATPGTGEVSALLVRPDDAQALYVLAHGAGAGMTHPFMESMASGLATRGIATFRFLFPYLEQGRKRPNPAARLEMTVRNAVTAGRDLCPGLPTFAGGKSMGGRITSQAAAKELMLVDGIVLLGFPLHAPGRESNKRGEHLAEVDHAMLFIQGTRDRLANLDLLGPILRRIGGRVTLHVVEGGDHSFKVLKRSGRSNDDALAEVVGVAADWMLATAGET